MKAPNTKEDLNRIEGIVGEGVEFRGRFEEVTGVPQELKKFYQPAADPIAVCNEQWDVLKKHPAHTQGMRVLEKIYR
jgi:hypothetical protein